MNLNMFLIEIFVKTTIIFFTIWFINYQMEDYISYHYGTIGYVAFTALTIGIGFIGQHFYFKRRIKKAVQHTVFTEMLNDCKELYKKSKNNLVTESASIKMIEETVACALADHHYLVTTYGNEEIEKAYGTAMVELLRYLSKSDTDTTIKKIDELLVLLEHIKFK